MSKAHASVASPFPRLARGLAMLGLIVLLCSGSECSFRSDHRCEERNAEGECIRRASSVDEPREEALGFRIVEASVVSLQHPDWHATRRVFDVRGVESVLAREELAYALHAERVLAENHDWIGISPFEVRSESWSVQWTDDEVRVTCFPVFATRRAGEERLRFAYEASTGNLREIDVLWPSAR